MTAETTRAMRAGRRTVLAGLAGVLVLPVGPALAKAGKDDLTRTLAFDPDQPVLGNPKGDVALVEFFDYQCPVCRKTHPDVARLVAGDGKIRWVLRDWPIFGAASERATILALGSVALGGYAKANAALMAVKGGRSTPAEVDAAVRAAGIDPAAAVKSFNRAYDKWTALVGRTMGIADMLGLPGTPVYMVGTDLHQGATPVDALRKAVQAARGKG